MDITPQEAYGKALLEARKLMPEKKLSEVQDIYLKFGSIEADKTGEGTNGACIAPSPPR